MGFKYSIIGRCILLSYLVGQRSKKLVTFKRFSFAIKYLAISFIYTSRYGAYSAKEIYSAEDTRKLIEYAQVRGVRVVIEIDSPAHAGNGWQWGPVSLVLQITDHFSSLGSLEPIVLNVGSSTEIRN